MIKNIIVYLEMFWDKIFFFINKNLKFVVINSLLNVLFSIKKNPKMYDAQCHI